MILDNSTQMVNSGILALGSDFTKAETDTQRAEHRHRAELGYIEFTLQRMAQIHRAFGLGPRFILCRTTNGFYFHS
jgi:hypothetical protein